MGSDPYLAPEVYDHPKYDPQPTDVWSLAIIFACMSLRRFPWKAPRITDNSFKLFISPPNPGTSSTEGTLKDAVAEVKPAGPEDQRISVPNEQHHHGDKSDGKDTSKTQEPGTRVDAPKAEVIKGPWRLLRLLPRDTRNIMGKMLQINPKQRATMDDVQADPWMSGTPCCQQIEGGRVIAAQGHTHTLEPGTTTAT